MRLNQKTFFLNTAGQVVTFDVVGSFVRCVDVTDPTDFEVSFDGGPYVPFGMARSISPTDDQARPLRFSRIQFRQPVTIGANTITVVIGDADYADDRAYLYPNQSIRAALFSTLTGGAVGILAGAAQVIGGGPGKMINVRNLDLAASVYLGTTNAFAVPNGYRLDPGENVDLPVGASVYCATSAAVSSQVQVSVFTF